MIFCLNAADSAGAVRGRARPMALTRAAFYKIVFAVVVVFAPVFGEEAAAQEARAQVFKSLGTVHISDQNFELRPVDGSLPLSAFVEQLRAVPQEEGTYSDVHEYFQLLAPSGNTVPGFSISGGIPRFNRDYSVRSGDVMRLVDGPSRSDTRLDIFVRVYAQIGRRTTLYLAQGEEGVSPPSMPQFKTADELEEGEFFLDASASFVSVSVMTEGNVGYIPPSPPPDPVTITTITTIENQVTLEVTTTVQSPPPDPADPVTITTTVQEEVIREITATIQNQIIVEVTTTVQNMQVNTVTTTVAGDAVTTTVTMFVEMEVVREVRTTVETVVNQEVTTIIESQFTVEVTTTVQTEVVSIVMATVRNEVIREITATIQNQVVVEVTTTVQNLQVSTMTTTLAGDSVTTTLTMVVEREVVREVIRTVETVLTREITTTLETVVNREIMGFVDTAPDGQPPPPSASDRGSGVIIGGAVVGGLMFWLSRGFTTGGFAYTPSFGYSITESGYYANVGGRLDFRKDRWHLYHAAGQTNANGDSGEFRYQAGGEYKADFWTAKFSESLRGATEDYRFSLSADWRGGVWRISPTYEIHARRELTVSETQNALYLFGEVRHHRWRIVSSAGFQWRQFGEFGDSARFRLQAVREF